MPTLSEMIEEVRGNLQGYSLRQDRITYLTNGIGSTDLTLQVGSADNLAKGLIEIDDELIWIDSFNKTNNTLNVMGGTKDGVLYPIGRGFQGTTESPHAPYAQVTLSPTFPRANIKKAINDTINSFYPKLFAVASTTFTFNASQVTYPLPDDAREVLYISWQTTGPSKEWLPVKRWRFDLMANAPTFNSEKTLNIYDRIQPGRTIKVWYAMVPNALDNSTDDFADVTGLPDSSYDVVTLGAAYKLLSYIDAGRINLSSAEADFADSKIPSTAGAGASRYVFALFQQRLNDEALKLADRFPIRLHYTR